MAKKMLKNKQQNEKVKLAVIELLESQERFKQIKDDYEKKREELQLKIRNFMFVNGVETFNFLAQSGDRFSKDNKQLKVTNVKQRKVDWDIPKLEERFDKELLNQFVKKEYQVNDWENLVKYLKSCGVNPKKFLSFITVSKTVDAKKLDELGELGEIEMKDLKGCYTISENVGYIKITELEE